MIPNSHSPDDFINSHGSFFWFHGVVEDINDPEKLGRVRVRCMGFHTENRAQLPTSALPWATCLLPITSASMAGVGQSGTGMLNGTWVVGFFRDGSSAQDPIIMGTIASSTIKKPDKSKGFSDSSGINPIRVGADIPDEAREDKFQSSSSYALKAGAGGIIPSPSSRISPKYPFNQVLKTKSGHTIEYDDTPGKERVSILHKSGSFIEFDSSGNMYVFTKGDLLHQVNGNVLHKVNGTYTVQATSINLN